MYDKIHYKLKKKKKKKKQRRRGGKNTQMNYTKKGVNDSDNQGGVVTHLEPDKSWIVKSGQALLWAKLVELMEFQLSYLKS